MAVTPETRRWEQLFAERTRGDVGDGIAFVLGFLGRPDLISFAGGFPDPLTFPRERASQLLEEFAANGEATAFQYTPTRGLAGTLDAVAGRLESVQGRRPDEDELVITSGGIEALELVCKTFLDRGDTVLIEAPTYLGAIMAFRGFEARIEAVPMDEDGLQVDALAALLEGGLRPKLLYTIPDHQNPAGVSLSVERREALVELARRYGFLVIEDVAYRELHFGEDALPSLWSLAPDAVVQAGTTSKTFLPASGSAGRPARRRSARSSSRRSRTPTSARARSGSGCSRSTSAAGGSRSSSSSRARSTAASVRHCSRRSSGTCRRASSGRGPRAGSSPG